jgi:hypothetical protein
MREPPITFYVMSAAELEELAAVAARHPLVGGKRVAEKIHRSLRRAATQYMGDSHHLVTVMAYLADKCLLDEADVAARQDFELHLGGRFTFYRTNAQQRARVTPANITPGALQAYWQSEQYQSTHAGDELHSALRQLHQGLTTVGDDAFLVIHW